MQSLSSNLPSEILSTEVVFAENASDILRERLEFPLFFLVGGADDSYLSRLVEQPITSLVQQKSVDPLPTWPIFGVYASRFLLPTIGYARTFPLSVFLNQTWPILSDIESQKTTTKEPTNVERVWVIRALRRAAAVTVNQQTQAELIALAMHIRNKMLDRFYPEKLSVEKIPSTLDQDSLRQLLLILSEDQQNYPLVMIVDDLPIKLDKTLGQVLKEIALNGCTSVDLRTLKTSLDLLAK